MSQPKNRILTLSIILVALFAFPRPTLAAPPTLDIVITDTSFYPGETANVFFNFSEPPAPGSFTNADVDLSDANGTIETITPTGDPARFMTVFTPSPNVRDTTNTIVVGTDWTNGGLEHPLVDSVSQNYSVVQPDPDAPPPPPAEPDPTPPPEPTPAPSEPTLPPPEPTPTPAPITPVPPADTTPPNDTPMNEIAQNQPAPQPIEPVAVLEGVETGADFVSRFAPWLESPAFSFLMGALAMFIAMLGVQKLRNDAKLRSPHRCRVCQGTGEQSKEMAGACAACDGTGQTEDENEPASECPHCEGEGDDPCHACKGTGMDANGQECSACKGGGKTLTGKQDKDGEDVIADCEVCHGEGEVAATVKRNIACEKCNGTGRS